MKARPDHYATAMFPTAKGCGGVIVPEIRVGNKTPTFYFSLIPNSGFSLRMQSEQNVRKMLLKFISG